MKIEKVVVGQLKENCYVLGDTSKVLVIDPGDEIDKIKKLINGREVVGVLITHSHFDHVGALSYFDKDLVYKYSNLEEKEYCISNFKFKVIFTPGHSMDSVSYYFTEYNFLFSGDFIFYENIGRCDLPGGDFNKMKMSIKKIKYYEDDMIIYPGHGSKTNLKHEKENNIYFKAA